MRNLCHDLAFFVPPGSYYSVDRHSMKRRVYPALLHMACNPTQHSDLGSFTIITQPCVSFECFNILLCIKSSDVLYTHALIFCYASNLVMFCIHNRPCKEDVCQWIVQEDGEMTTQTEVTVMHDAETDAETDVVAVKSLPEVTEIKNMQLSRLSEIPGTSQSSLSVNTMTWSKHMAAWDPNYKYHKRPLDSRVETSETSLYLSTSSDDMSEWSSETILLPPSEMSSQTGGTELALFFIGPEQRSQKSGKFSDVSTLFPRRLSINPTELTDHLEETSLEHLKTTDTDTDKVDISSLPTSHKSNSASQSSEQRKSKSSTRNVLRVKSSTRSAFRNPFRRIQETNPFVITDTSQKSIQVSHRTSIFWTLCCPWCRGPKQSDTVLSASKQQSTVVFVRSRHAEDLVVDEMMSNVQVN